MKNKITYELDLRDYEDLERIKYLLSTQLQTLSILNKDSEKSVEGGASVYYTVKLTFEEKWI